MSSEEKIRNEKRELRKQIRSKLKQLITEEITAQSEAAWKQSLHVPINAKW